MKGLHRIGYDLGFPEGYRFAYGAPEPTIGESWRERADAAVVAGLEARLAAEAVMDEIEASR